MEIKKLKNPPITEAIIEVRFLFRTEVNLDKLRALIDDQTYPFVSNTMYQQVNLSDQGDQKSKAIQTGYIARNTTNTRAVQLHVDRFSVSHVEEYDGWESLVEFFKGIYDRYIEAMEPMLVTRISTRYINRIEIPFWKPDFRIEDYIECLPKIPEGIVEDYSVFESTVVLNDTANEINSRFRQLLKGVEKSTEYGARDISPYIVDIDVSHDVKVYEPQDSSIFDKLEIMRDKKNILFFHSVKEKALEPYQ